MEKKLPKVVEPKETDFYSIEPDGNGGKEIHVLGYCYQEDKWRNAWRNVEYSFFIEPLRDFIEHMKADENYPYNKASEVKQYISDCTANEMVDIINCYFNGSTPDHLLPYSDITIDTPCGNYIC